MHPSDERATRVARQARDCAEDRTYLRSELTQVRGENEQLRARLAAERERAERAEADALTWRQQAELAWHRLDLTASEDMRAALWPEVVGAERRVIAAAKEWREAGQTASTRPDEQRAGFDRRLRTWQELEMAVDALVLAEAARKGEAE